jgi:hypothetical protein
VKVNLLNWKEFEKNNTKNKILNFLFVVFPHSQTDREIDNKNFEKKVSDELTKVFFP